MLISDNGTQLAAANKERIKTYYEGMGLGQAFKLWSN
jgi:hypothetical protein